MISRLWDNDQGIAFNQHRIVCFRRHFRLSSPCRGATLFVAADSDFIVFLDGREILRGQYPDDPCVKSYDSVFIPELSAEEHLLAIKVYYCGGEFSGYTPGLPGLYVDWTLQGVSAGQWLAHEDDSFRSGAMPKVSPQLGFTTEYDLRRQFDFSSPELDDSGWRPAQELSAAPGIVFRPRPAGTKCQLGEFRPMKCIRSGRLCRFTEGVPGITAAQSVSADNCYADSTSKSFPIHWSIPEGYEFTGLWLIADLGGEETGMVEFEVEAPAGTRIDCAHGEHLFDGRVRAEICGRNFADTVYCKAGVTCFTLPFRRVGARYLELHFTGQKGGDVTVRRVGIRPWRLPLPSASAFDCSDGDWMELRRRGVHTLELCMHEHYEDCPWREQGMYTYDSRTQILYGYCLWGNYDFAKAALELFRFAPRQDCHLRLCVPSRGEIIIPVYSLVWMAEIYEHYLYSGDITLFLLCRQTAERMLLARLAEFDTATGLYRTDAKLWNFYEWAPGVNGRDTREAEFHALYNLYLLECLECYARLLEAAGEDAAEVRQRADALRRAVEGHFFDAQSGLYASYSDAEGGLFGFHEHTQALMLTTGSVPEEKRPALLRALADRTLVPMTLSSLPYKVWAMEAGTPADRNAIADMVMGHYRTMLAASCDTLWETENGQDDFFYAGSLCHGWSALPIYVMQSIILGIKPLEPGFRRFRVAPAPGGLRFASGEMPTPAGRIQVSWRLEKDNGTLRICVPAGLHPEVDLSNFPVSMTTEIVGENAC